MVFSSVERLSVIISPGGKHFISLTLAGASVGLDLDATNRLENRDYVLVSERRFELSHSPCEKLEMTESIKRCLWLDCHHQGQCQSLMMTMVMIVFNDGWQGQRAGCCSIPMVRSHSLPCWGRGKPGS